MKSLARLYHRLGSPERSAQVLEQQVRDFPDATDLTHINILAELFMDAGKYEQASNLIRQAERLPCMQDGVPVDLRVSTVAVPYWDPRAAQVSMQRTGQSCTARALHGPVLPGTVPSPKPTMGDHTELLSRLGQGTQG